jgi:hypothetical protein
VWRTDRDTHLVRRRIANGAWWLGGTAARSPIEAAPLRFWLWLSGFHARNDGPVGVLDHVLKDAHLVQQNAPRIPRRLRVGVRLEDEKRRLPAFHAQSDEIRRPLGHRHLNRFRHCRKPCVCGSTPPIYSFLDRAGQEH